MEKIVSTTMVVTASDAVARARELIPELRERAPQTALDRRLPLATIDALRKSGALKTIQATRNGGYALGIRSHLDVISALGEGCGSTAWVAGVVHAHSWLRLISPSKDKTTSTAQSRCGGVSGHRPPRQGGEHRRRVPVGRRLAVRFGLRTV